MLAVFGGIFSRYYWCVGVSAVAVLGWFYFVGDCLVRAMRSVPGICPPPLTSTLLRYSTQCRWSGHDGPARSRPSCSPLWQQRLVRVSVATHERPHSDHQKRTNESHQFTNPCTLPLSVSTRARGERGGGSVGREAGRQVNFGEGNRHEMGCQ